MERVHDGSGVRVGRSYLVQRLCLPQVSTSVSLASRVNETCCGCALPLHSLYTDIPHHPDPPRSRRRSRVLPPWPSQSIKAGRSLRSLRSDAMRRLEGAQPARFVDAKQWRPDGDGTSAMGDRSAGEHSTCCEFGTSTDKVCLTPAQRESGGNGGGGVCCGWSCPSQLNSRSPSAQKQQSTL